MISKDIIEEIKQRTSIEEVIGRYVDLKKRGKNWIGLCPFHGEKTPSFNVRADKGYYKCFGCGASGDVFSFLEAQTGQSFVEVAADLARTAGVELPQAAQSRPQRPPAELLQVQLMNRAATHYVRTLNQPVGRLARQYLMDQRCLSEDLLERYQIGFAASGQNQFAALELTEDEHAAAKNTGLLRASQDGTLRDSFLGRIIFPIQNIRGEVIAFGGRVFRTQDANKPKYINSNASEIYRKSETFYGLKHALPGLKRGQPAILVEGYFDVLAFAAAGVSEAIASCGTSVTWQHLERLKRRTSQLVICMDGDSAGQRAMKKSAMLALAMGFDVQVAELSEGDPADVLEGLGPKAVLGLLQQKKNVIEWRLSATRMLAQRSVEDRIRGLRDMLPWVAAVADPLAQKQWLKALADEFDEDQDFLGQQVQHVGRPIVDRFVAAARARDAKQEKESHRGAVGPGKAQTAPQGTQLGKEKHHHVQRAPNVSPQPVRWSRIELLLAEVVMAFPELADAFSGLGDAEGGLHFKNRELAGLMVLCRRFDSDQVGAKSASIRDHLSNLSVTPGSPLIERVRHFDIRDIWGHPETYMDMHSAQQIVDDVKAAAKRKTARARLLVLNQEMAQNPDALATLFEEQKQLVRLLAAADKRPSKTTPPKDSSVQAPDISTSGGDALPFVQQPPKPSAEGFEDLWEGDASEGLDDFDEGEDPFSW